MSTTTVRQTSLWVRHEGTTAYRLYVIRHTGYLKAHVREVTLDPDSPGTYSYFPATGWVADVGLLACKRVTDKVWGTFVDNAYLAAEALVERRIRSLKEAS